MDGGPDGRAREDLGAPRRDGPRDPDRADLVKASLLGKVRPAVGQVLRWDEQENMAPMQFVTLDAFEGVAELVIMDAQRTRDEETASTLSPLPLHEVRPDREARLRSGCPRVPGVRPRGGRGAGR